MKTIKAKALTVEGFAKYGEFQDLLDDESMKKKSIFPAGFLVDLVKLDFGGDTLPAISVGQVFKKERNVVSFLEAHEHTCEGVLPLDGDVLIFVGTTHGDPSTFTVDELEAFFVPKGTFVKLNPLIVHGTQYAVEDEEVHVVIMLPGRTFCIDMLAKRLTSEDEQAELVC